MYVSRERVFEMRGGRVALGATLVLDDVDFRLDQGEFLALLGANGSGKTTLVRALLGLAPLSAGAVTIYGIPIDRFRAWSRIGYVPQRTAAVASTPASVMEVALSGRVGAARRLRPYTRRDRAAALHALGLVDLDDRARVPVSHLSGGQQQRVMIARALAAEPDALVLDEPTSGIDLERQERLATTLERFVEDGGSVILVAHTLAAMEDLVSREVVMHAGTVTYEGPHLPHHVHAEHVHHPESRIEHSPLDRAAGRI